MGDAIPDHLGEPTWLGSFEIVRRLARGGMADILLARAAAPAGPPEAGDSLVVLKKILPRYAGKPRYVQLFLEEARLAASLDHPSIVKAYDAGMADGAYFFAMEYLHGQDVRSILHRAWRTGERFPIEHAVQIARHVAAALHFAHELRRDDGSLLGIVHRDVSPSNIIVTYDGATKLLDFGVAKTAASTVKTRTGTLKGKISYMSPEQARGASIDRRSDIFSLGIVLWEMVTTQRLYKADNDLATLQLIITRPPRTPSSVRPDCPPALERIVLRALAQDPDARYATADELRIDLDELAGAQRYPGAPAALAVTLGQLFRPELAAWRDAHAAGVPLGEHLHDQRPGPLHGLHGPGDLTTPVSESDFVDPAEGLDDEGADDDDGGEDADVDGDIDRGVDDGDALDRTELARREEPDLDGDLTEHAAPIIDTMSPLATEPTPEALAPTLLHGPDGPQAAPPAPITLLGVTPEAAATSRPHAMSPPHGVLLGVAGSRTGSPLSAAPWQSGQPSPPLPSPPPLPLDRPGRPWSIVELPPIDPQLFDRQRHIVVRITVALIGVVIVLAIVGGHC